MTKLGILFASLLLHSMVLQDTRASIEGVVVHDMTGKPVSMASVELTVVEGPKVVSRVTTSTADGRFSFKDLPPAEGYQIVVTGPRLWPTAYGQHRSYGPWTPITLTAGQHLTDVRIAAHAINRISGRVVDAAGIAQSGASVFAMRPTYVDGRREIQRAANTVTNLRGEYQFTNLPPGRYYIRATARNEGAADILLTNPALHDRRAATAGSNDTKEVEGYPVVYHPGVALESARAVPLGDGQVVEGIDITVAKSQTTRVRGNVTSRATGKKTGPAQVQLLPVGSSPDSNWVRSYRSKDGSFDFRAVLPGKYFLTATVDANRQLAGKTAVEIRSGNTQTHDVTVSPVVDIHGRITLESAVGAMPDLSSAAVKLVANFSQPIDGTLSRARTNPPLSLALVKADGTFTLPAVAPLDYRLVVSAIPGAYVKAARYGGIDVLENGVRIEGNDSDSLEIVLATDGRRLDGRTVQGTPSRIVLVPEQRHRYDLYFATTSSNTGRFEFTNIPPGRYKVFAWQNPAEGAWTDPDYLERYEDQGTPVDLQSESPAAVEVREIAAI
jgi:hypothetical protein